MAKEGRGVTVGDSGKNVKRIPGSEILWAIWKGEGRETRSFSRNRKESHMIEHKTEYKEGARVGGTGSELVMSCMQFPA